MKFLRGVAAALFSLFAVAAAQAQDAGPPGWLTQIDLTEAQQDKILQIFQAAAPLIRERLQAARDAHEELENLAIGINLNSDEGRQAFQVEVEALAQVAEIRKHAMSAVYHVLTDEQRARAVKHDIEYE